MGNTRPPGIRVAVTLGATAAVLAALACAGSPGPDPARSARLQRASGQTALAALSIEQAVRAQPQDVALRVSAAEIQLEAGNENRAVLHLEVARSLHPWDAEISIRLGEVEQSRGNVTDAYVAFHQAALLAPDDVRAVSGLALAADALGFDKEAAAAYEHWAELEAEADAGGAQ